MPSLCAWRNAHKLIKFFHVNVTALPLQNTVTEEKLMLSSEPYIQRKRRIRLAYSVEYSILTPLIRSWKTAGPGWKLQAVS